MSRPPVTPAGYGLLTLAAGCYAAGALLGHAVLVSIAAGLSALLGAGACTVVLRPSVRISRELPTSRTTVGEPVVARLLVHNPSRGPSGPFTAVERLGAETFSFEVGSVLARGRRTRMYPVPAPRRGRMPLGPLTVERSDPFGLFRRSHERTGEDLLWVLPRIHPMRAMPVGLVTDHDDPVDERLQRGTLAFSTLRDYTPGDDPRRIHWRSTARRGTLVVREHMDAAEPASTSIVLDTRAGAHDGDSFEHAVEVAASALHAAERNGGPAVLRILGEAPDPGLDGLERLTLAAATAEHGLAELLALVGTVPSGGALLLVTGRADAELLARLTAAARGFRPVVVISPSGPRAEIRRLPGLLVLTAGSAAETAAGWNRMVSGGAR